MSNKDVRLVRFNSDVWKHTDSVNDGISTITKVDNNSVRRERERATLRLLGLRFRAAG